MAVKKLFELLVIEPQLKTQAETTRADLKNTFEKKRHLFEEKRKTFQSTEDSSVPPTIEEQSDIQTNVPDELSWIADIWSKSLDTTLQIAAGNAWAKSDVVLDDGTVLLHEVPATALLALEKRLGDIHQLVLSVPTLDPAKGFSLDPDKGKNIYRAREVRKLRTKKVQEPITLAPATVEHPAQVQLVTIDRPIGNLIEQEWSGLVTPRIKGDMIERVEELRRAFKAALHRANTTVTQDPPLTCGQILFNRILGARAVNV
jgi:hypothetical protein